MKTRAITGFFFIIVMLASVLMNHWVFGGFYLVLSVLCLREFYSLVKESGASPNQAIGILNGIFIYVIFALITADNLPGYHKLLFLVILTFTGVFTQELFKK
jgi:phosphatidate cytidylyltransferase